MANKGDLLLEMKDVKKRFGGAIALRGTNLSVRAGEISGATLMILQVQHSHL